jgi:hypothetical protein
MVPPPGLSGGATRSAQRRARRKRAAEHSVALPALCGAGYLYNQPVGCRALRSRSLNWREAPPPAHFLVDPELEDPARLAGLLERISRSEVGIVLPGLQVASLLRSNAQFCSDMNQFAQKYAGLRLRPLLENICSRSSRSENALGLALATQHVVRFLRAVVHKCGLLAVLGSAANQRWTVKCIRFYVTRPKLTRCPLGQLMSGLKVEGVAWLRTLPRLVAVHLLAKFLGKLHLFYY